MKTDKMLQKPDPIRDTKNKAASMDSQENGIYHFVASKEVRDRDNDLIYVGPSDKGVGIDYTEFMTNPVFLKCHDDDEFPIGRVVKLAGGADANGTPQLEIWVEFAKTEAGMEAEYLYANGFMSAVSIRFRPTEYIYNDIEKGYDVFSSKLYEVSAVSIQANQEALLIKGWKAERENEALKKALQEKEKSQGAIKDKLEEIQKTVGGREPDSATDNTQIILDAILANINGSTKNG